MTGSSLLIATAVASSVFAGLLLVLLPRLPNLAAPQLGLTEARWRGGQVCAFLSLVLMMLVGGVGIDKWGIRPVLLSGLLTALLGMVLLERCHTKPLAGVVCALFGAAAGAAILATVQLCCRAFYADHPAASSNLGFIGLTLGVLVAPGLIDRLTLRIGVGRALPLLALLGLIPAALAVFTPRDDYPVVRDHHQLVLLGGDLHLWLLAGAVVCYQAVEASLPGWSGNYLGGLGLSPQKAGVRAVTSAGAWFIVGQAAAAYFLPPGAEAGMIVLLAICLGILLGNTVGNDRPLSGIAGMVVAFACIGPLLPTLLGLAVQRYPQGQAAVLGTLLAVNTVAAGVFAPVTKPGRAPLWLCLGGVLLLAAVVLMFALLK